MRDSHVANCSELCYNMVQKERLFEQEACDVSKKGKQKETKFEWHARHDMSTHYIQSVSTCVTSFDRFSFS